MGDCSSFNAARSTYDLIGRKCIILAFDEDVKLDMLIIGAVAVDREGRHIGRGHGYVDLDYALLAHLGMVTKDTLIVTTVHDVQVRTTDTKPSSSFCQTL